MSKILITGAAGFISSKLLYRLYKDGNDVIFLDNFSYGHDDNLVFEDKDFRKEILNVDIRNERYLDILFDENNFDIVYHFAGITPLPDCQNNPELAIDVNVRGTIVLLELARKYGVKKFIFASTSAVYENNTDFPSVEENVRQPSLIYPNTKYAAELFLKSYFDCYNMPITIFRFANVYGPHMDCLRTKPPVIAYIIKELYFDRSPVIHSSGNQERDFIYVDDLVDLAVKVGCDIKKISNVRKCDSQFEILNVSSNKTISINKIIEIIKTKMKKSHIDTIYEDPLNYWKEYSELYIGAFPINKKLLEKEVQKYTCLSNEKAKQKYNWSPKVSMEEGIEKTIKWIIKNLYEKNC